MNFFKRFMSKKRRYLRVDVRLSVKLDAANGKEVQGWTVDISESGFRMELPDEVNPNEMVGGSRNLNIRVLLDDDSDPVMAVAEFIWASRDEASGPQYTGWMFSHMIEGEDRLREFIQESNDGSRTQ